MRGQVVVEPFWAVLVVRAVVNAMDLLQGIGFLSRLPSGSLALNHALGYGILALGIPAVVAVVAFFRAGARPAQ